MGVALGAGRGGQFGPGGGGSRVEVHGAIDSAGGAIDHGGVEAVEIVGVERQGDDGPAEVFEGVPRVAEVGRIEQPAGSSVNGGVQAVFVPGVHVVNGGNRGINKAV